MDNYNYSYNYKNNNNNWRKQKEERFNQMGAGLKPRSHNSRNPTFGWQPYSWEIEFCATAGVPWKKVLDTKKYMSNDDKVLKWSDSAAKEAFMNAKKRFWAQMHGQPCDVKLPDPDIFIDKVDWDADVDPVLMLDLENEEPNFPCETDKRDGSGVILGIPVVPEQYLLTPTGWGDAEEAKPQPINNCEQHDYGNGYDQWDGNYANEEGERKTWSRGWHDGDDGYGYVTENRASGGQNRDNGSTWYGNNNKKQWDHGYKNKKQWDHGYNNKKWDHGANNTSRYKISRFHNNGNRQPMVDDDGYKRGNFGNERPLIQWRPVSRRW